MIGKKQYPALITAEEAVRVGQAAGECESIHRVTEIYHEWKKSPQFPDSPGYDFWCMLAAMYDAGRIQGIREERSRRKGQK